MFYAGVALLAATAVVGVVFLIRRPVYRPEDAAAILDDGRTQPLHNAYPTDPLTVRQTAHGQMVNTGKTVILEEETEGTALLQEEAAEETEILPQPGEATVPLTAEQPGEATVPLAEATVPLAGEATVPLDGESTVPLVTEERP